MPPTASIGPPHAFGEGDATPGTALCSACQTVTVPSLMRELNPLPEWLERSFSQSTPRGMLHLPDARQLPNSAAKGCPLCRMILDAVLKWEQSDSAVCQDTHVERLSKRASHVYDSTWSSASEQDVAQFQEDLIDRPIYLRPSTTSPKQQDVLFPDKDMAGPNCLCGFQALVPVSYGVLKCQIILYALPATPAAISGDVIMRPALDSSGSPEAFSLVSRWLDACLSGHEVCSRAVCGLPVNESSPPILPSRIIHIGKSGNALCPRIIETEGERAHYVALSHCLGKVACHLAPDGTAQVSLQSDMVGIPWNRLPRAFQDAMIISHHLGLDYIWIDTLCRVQDSAAEQLSQSERKDAIFENARLTIAASHATEYCDSLFPQRPDPPPIVRLQHISADGVPAGFLFALPKRQDNHLTLPEFSPLSSHAQVTEELLFSRRIVFYTPNTITWSCKRLSQRETGLQFHSTCRNLKWRVVVEKHAARSMASLSDRLGGLDALQREIGKLRPHDEYCLGLWRNNLPMHLLWYCLQPALRSENSLSLPTWTWASVMSSVLFAGRFCDQRSKPKSSCKVTRFDKTSKTMVVRGTIKSINRLAKWTDDVEWKYTTPHDILASMNSLHGSPSASQKRYVLGNDGAVIGWAFIDEPDVPRNGIRCLPVMTQMISAKKLRRKLPLFHAWVLLLPGSEDDFGQFQRIGMGVITTVDPWFDDQAQTQIFLG